MALLDRIRHVRIIWWSNGQIMITALGQLQQTKKTIIANLEIPCDSAILFSMHTCIFCLYVHNNTDISCCMCVHVYICVHCY